MNGRRSDYEKSEILIILFDGADVIATSSLFGDGGIEGDTDSGGWTPRN